LEIRKAGGITLAQDEASCVVYGMPKFAQGLGAVQEVLSLDELGSFIRGFCRPGIGLKK